MDTFKLIAFLFLLALISGRAVADQTIQTKVISCGEVADMQVSVRSDGQSVTVTGIGFKVCKNGKCGYPEITFLDSNGRVLLRKVAVYQIPMQLGPRPALSDQIRRLKFSVTVPNIGPTALVVVQPSSTLHWRDCTLKYVLDRFSKAQ
jgi:hypothetical protein